MKHPIFKKIAYFSTVSVVSFIYKQNFTAQELKTRTANAKLLLYNLRDSAFNYIADF